MMSISDTLNADVHFSPWIIVRVVHASRCDRYLER